MEAWVKDIRSWDLCDQACSNLFDQWPGAYEKAPDEHFTQFFPNMERESKDNRNFAKKAVNWALRATGNRNIFLNQQAIALSRKLSESDDKTACWIGRNALQELESQKVQKRLQGKTL